MTTVGAKPVAHCIFARDGGTVTSLASHTGPDSTTTVFAGTLTGVFRSDDNGCSWSATSPTLRSPFVDVVAVSPAFANDETVVAGTLDSGLHISYDGGRRWRRRDFWGAHPTISALSFSPKYAEDGTIAAGAEGGGVYLTDNWGQSWNGCGPELADADITALAVAPHDADVLLVGAVGGGVMRSTNKARSWSVGSGVPVDATVSAIAVSPAFDSDGHALAGTEAHGIYCSVNHGETWKVVDDIPSGKPVNGLTYMSGSTAVVASGNSLWRSIDGGVSWQRLSVRGTSRAPILALATAADGTVLAGVAGAGVVRSDDAGETWSLSNAGLTSLPLFDLQLSPNYHSDGVLMAGCSDEGVLISRDGGQSWSWVTDGFPTATVNRLALSPGFSSDGCALALAADALFCSADGGDTWETVATVPEGTPITSVAFSPAFAEDRIIALGGYGGDVFLSKDAGMSWTPVAENFQSSAIVEMAFSPRFADNGTILAAATGHGSVAVYRSADRGETWSRYVQMEGAYHWASIAVPDAHDSDEEFFCLATGAHILRPSGTVAGHWNSINPCGNETAIRAVQGSLEFAEDDTLFAATSGGLMRSTDRGRLWAPLVGALADVPIESVVVSRNASGRQELFVTTIHGELWRVDDPVASGITLS